MGADLPFNPNRYLADGVKPGSDTEKQMLRINGRWCVQRGIKCPSLDTILPTGAPSGK